MENTPLSREELVSVLEAINVIAYTMGGSTHYRIKNLIIDALKNEPMKPSEPQYSSVGEELECLRHRATMSERKLLDKLSEEELNSKRLVKKGHVWVGNVIRRNKSYYKDLWTVIRVVERGIVVECRKLSNPHQSMLDWVFLEKEEFIIVS